MVDSVLQGTSGATQTRNQCVLTSLVSINRLVQAGFANSSSQIPAEFSAGASHPADGEEGLVLHSELLPGQSGIQRTGRSVGPTIRFTNTRGVLSLE